MHSDTPTQVLTNHAFVSIVISLASTFGIWMIASLLFVRGALQEALLTTSSSRGTCSPASCSTSCWRPGMCALQWAWLTVQLCQHHQHLCVLRNARRH